MSTAKRKWVCFGASAIVVIVLGVAAIAGMNTAQSFEPAYDTEEQPVSSTEPSADNVKVSESESSASGADGSTVVSETPESGETGSDKPSAERADSQAVYRSELATMESQQLSTLKAVKTGEGPASDSSKPLDASRDNVDADYQPDKPSDDAADEPNDESSKPDTTWGVIS